MQSRKCDTPAAAASTAQRLLAVYSYDRMLTIADSMMTFLTYMRHRLVLRWVKHQSLTRSLEQPHALHMRDLLAVMFAPFRRMRCAKQSLSKTHGSKEPLLAL